jgi:hypothetical protein
MAANAPTLVLVGVVSPTLKDARFGDYNEVIVMNNGFIITMSFTAVTLIIPHNGAFNVGVTYSFMAERLVHYIFEAPFKSPLMFFVVEQADNLVND